jgi:hypothetical protein
MSRLADLQHSFQDYVLADSEPPLPEWVSADGRAAPRRQLSVYSNAYRMRLKEVLGQDYEAVWTALGDEGFDRLTDQYIDAHPSRRFTLRDFGRVLPAFLQTTPEYREYEWLHELAEFESLLIDAFDAADASLLREEDMAGLPPEAWSSASLIVHPSVRRLDSCWDAPRLWQVLTSDDPSEIIPARSEPVPWLIWRRELTTQFRSMSVDEQTAFDAMVDGASLDAVCVALGTRISEEEVPLRFASLLKGWIAEEIVSGIG